MNRRRWLWLLGITLAVTPCSAPAQDDFYRGKTVRIVVGFSAGGGFDTFARTLGRHLGRHLPGNPTIIVENMPGAGSLIAANHLYKVAKPDGLTIGHFIGGLFLGQVLGQKGIEFDARKFEFIGAPAPDHVVCAMTKASGITSLERWIAAPAPVKMGGVAPGSSTPDNATRAIKAALGLPIQLVSGYKGTADIRLAAEAGELAGTCFNWGSIRATWRKALEAGEVVVLLQLAPRSHAELAGVPLAIDRAKTDEARRLLEVAIHADSAIVRSLTLPPGTPKARVQTVRKAFLDTLRDPVFLAEAEQAKLEIEPVTGEEMERVIERLFKLEPALIARLKGILYD
ncbi:MAG TPA: tripartite tricarboxylate transporter substrate-binding protein [Methylomirabilota bacterium]|jgi:tripartite-type tricarboxylate transporter receptor subunit TctC|nr:tripartite tricarboxylate transporter substrate-binding protein [Methylomirabilota bacterium]